MQQEAELEQESTAEPETRRWYTTARFRLITSLIGLVLVIGFGYTAVSRGSDFDWHHGYGRYFLQNDLQAMRGEWYLLSRAGLNACIAPLPVKLARLVVLGLALCLLGLSFRLLDRMSGSPPTDRATAFAVAAFTLLALMPYWTRDLQECGLQMILLALLLLAGHALWAGRSIQAGLWLALAVCYKTTPLLCSAVLIWKRRWSAAGAMLIGVVALNCLPAAYLGWETTLQRHLKTWQYVRVSSQSEDIAENPIEPPNPKNQALIALFARYLQTYSPGHALHFEHPWFVQFGALDRATARHLAKGVMLLLAAWVAWRMWGKASLQAREFPEQWAVVCVFCALISPLCWRQHLVLAIPLAYLLIRRFLVERDATWRLGMGLLIATVIIWIPQRELMGRTLSLLLMAFKPDTLVLLAGVLYLMNWKVRHSPGSQGQEVREPARELPRLPAAA